MTKKMMAVFLLCILVLAALEISAVAAGEEANNIPRKKSLFSRIFDKLGVDMPKNN
ncbi:hypothetical protein Csa_020977 [Cucumis sativus]|uniref:Uncharacterized protein n=1 Tax=Cucumis sativus TaxID=3659 RepID=A0A0A0KFK4_CUCSA|nr:hypothetical protein Csa_020977 [Cucumis sativus]